MNTYFATFTTGLQEVIPLALREALPDVVIKKCEDGFIVFASDEEIGAIVTIRFFNNVFSLIKTFKDVGPGTKAMNSMVKKAMSDDNLFYHLSRKLPERKLSFRVMFVRENQMVKHDRNILGRFEEKILENRRLKIERSLPDVEFWFYMRREGDAYFGIRLTYHTEYAKLLEKGELRPEIAYILCFLSDPQKGQVFVDPFAGWGSIPSERLSAFPESHIWALDTDQKQIDALHKRFQGKHVTVKKVDALHMSIFQDNSVDVIVTDPPWGITQGKNLHIPDFYADMLKEFDRVLSPKGTIVLLVANNDVMENSLSNAPLFSVSAVFSILVSGQKARIYVLRKS